VMAAIAHVSAFINLFNLLPVWQLDGGRGFRPLSRNQRWMAAAAIGLAWAITHEGLNVLLLIAAVFQAWQAPASEEGDAVALTQYAGLVLALSLLSTIHVAVPGGLP
jgi:Zn-dependent protease